MNKLHATVPKKVLQVRYRNPRGILELFWSTSEEDAGAILRFGGCKIMRALLIKGTGLYKNYAHELGVIEIPTTLLPNVIEVDEPEWWLRSREDANKLLAELEGDTAAQAMGRHIAPFAESLTDFLTQLPPDEQARMGQKILTGGMAQDDAEE